MSSPPPPPPPHVLPGNVTQVKGKQNILAYFTLFLPSVFYVYVLHFFLQILTLLPSTASCTFFCIQLPRQAKVMAGRGLMDGWIACLPLPPLAYY